MPAQVERYIRGETSPVMVYVATAKAVPFGSLVGIATAGTLMLAADQTWNTNEATTRSDFVATFAGVAMQEKAANQVRIPGNTEDNAIRLATTGVYEFNITSASNFVNGVTLIGPDKDIGNALQNTSCKIVTAQAEAVAVAFQTKTSVTKIWGKLLSVRFRTDAP